MARLWDVKEEKSVMQYSGHHKAIVCVALNDTDNASDVHKPSSSSSSHASSGQSLQQQHHHQQLQQQQQIAKQQSALQSQKQHAQTSRADLQRQQLVGAAISRHPPESTKGTEDSDDGVSSDSEEDSLRSP